MILLFLRKPYGKNLKTARQIGLKLEKFHPYCILNSVCWIRLYPDKSHTEKPPFIRRCVSYLSILCYLILILLDFAFRLWLTTLTRHVMVLVFQKMNYPRVLGFTKML